MLRLDVRQLVRKQAIEKPGQIKPHFTEAHIELLETATSIEELGFHNVSAIVDQIVEQLRMKTVNGNNPPPHYPLELAETPLPPPPPE